MLLTTTSAAAMASSSILNLPNELLVQILRLVPLSDLLQCSLVCKQWHGVVHTRSLHDRSVIVFRDHDAYLDGFTHFAKCSPDTAFKRVCLQNVSICYVPELWDRIMPEVTSLSLMNCEISERDLSSILLHANSLEELRLEEARELFISGIFLDNVELVTTLRSVLSGVKVLSLANNQYLTDSLFNRILACTPNVSHLILDGCKIMNHSGIYKKYYPESMDIKASPSVFTFRNVMKILNERRDSIVSLNLNSTSIDGLAVQDLAGIAGLRLTHLDLGKCSSVSQEAILELVKRQSGLQSLGLDYCRRVFVDYPATSLLIFQQMAALKHLALKGLSIPKDLELFLAQTDSLSTLNMAELDASGADLSRGILASKSKFTLRSLTLTNFVCNPDSLGTMLQNLPNLRELHLKNCQEGVTDEVLQKVIQHMAHIQIINVSDCRRLTDAGFIGAGFVGKDPNVIEDKKAEGKIFLGTKAEAEVLDDARRQDLMWETSGEMLEHDGPKIDRLKALTSLEVATSKISDRSLRFAFRFRDLRHINVTLCPDISDTGFILLGDNNPHLESIVAKQCRITDTGLVGMVKSTPRLTKLDLEYCKEITSSAIKCLPIYCKNLRELNVSFCLKVKVNAINELVANLKYLRNPIIRGLHIGELLDSGGEEEDALVAPTPPPPPPL